MSASPAIRIRADRGSASIAAAKAVGARYGVSQSASVRVRPAVTTFGDARRALVQIQARRRLVVPAHTSPAPALPNQDSIIEGIAAQDLGGHRFVYQAADGFRYADAMDHETADAVVGITIGAAMAGSNVRVRYAGEIEFPAPTLTPRDAVFLGANGHITQVPPDDGDALVVGIARSTSVLLLRLLQPIQLSED